jgi:putative hydrolase of the HAD superfamily
MLPLYLRELYQPVRTPWLRGSSSFRLKSPMKLQRQNLLIDADDTLWENNIYFERVIAMFISFLNHREFTPQQVREVLYEVERENIKTHGYGLSSFTKALVLTFEQLSVEPITPTLHATIEGFARTIAEHPMEIIAGVEPTLEYLRKRHRLLVVTKGDSIEQAGKFERSGLAKYFESIEIVSEKNAASYRLIIDTYNLDPTTTWMIGNSPKSDINPALAAGLNAVFVPHANTWALEHEVIDVCPNGQLLLSVEAFQSLREHF